MIARTTRGRSSGSPTPIQARYFTRTPVLQMRPVLQIYGKRPQQSLSMDMSLTPSLPSCLNKACPPQKDDCNIRTTPSHLPSTSTPSPVAQCCQHFFRSVMNKERLLSLFVRRFFIDFDVALSALSYSMRMPCESCLERQDSRMA